MSEYPVLATHIVISGALVPQRKPTFHQHLEMAWIFGNHHTLDSFNAASLAAGVHFAVGRAVSRLFGGDASFSRACR